MVRTRKKIEFCYLDYIQTLSDEELGGVQERLAPLVTIMEKAASDRDIIAEAKSYDAEHGTDMFGEAIKFTAYCLACSKFDCDC
jgi:hypothetical protein